MEQLPRDLVDALGVSGARSLTAGQCRRLPAGDRRRSGLRQVVRNPASIPWRPRPWRSCGQWHRGGPCPGRALVSEEALALEWMRRRRGARPATDAGFGAGSAVHAAPAPHVGWLARSCRSASGPFGGAWPRTTGGLPAGAAHRAPPAAGRRCGNLDPAASALLESLARGRPSWQVRPEPSLCAGISGPATAWWTPPGATG
ncbi:hypothetical protein QJS66_11850 [Kocuria rhizophila]|nr:hypothetical protein QJS66_11850 [Kocuria rhizophila]